MNASIIKRSKSKSTSTSRSRSTSTSRSRFGVARLPICGLLPQGSRCYKEIITRDSSTSAFRGRYEEIRSESLCIRCHRFSLESLVLLIFPIPEPVGLYRLLCRWNHAHARRSGAVFLHQRCRGAFEPNRSWRRRTHHLRTTLHRPRLEPKPGLPSSTPP